jgi:hypothetical protein
VLRYSVIDIVLFLLIFEDNLFSLNHPNSYFNFNNPTIEENEAMRNIEQVVNSLFSVLVTLGKVPIIQCPKGNTI